MTKILALALAGVSLVMPAHAQERISHGSFDNVALYRPDGEAKQFVLMLSGETGWDKSMDQAARGLNGEGAMVAGIDMRRLRKKFRGGGGDCVLPDGDLENLSHYLQGYARQPTYRTPLLVGYGRVRRWPTPCRRWRTRMYSLARFRSGSAPCWISRKPLCNRDDLHFFDNSKGSRVSAAVPESKLAPAMGGAAGRERRQLRSFRGA